MRGKPTRTVDAAAIKGRDFEYFDFVMAAFVAILLLSNVLGAGKIASIDLPGIGAWPFGAGILFFPLSYVIGDVLTEVYGYGRARRCIWVGFCALLFMAFMSWVVVVLPPDANWHGQQAYEAGVRPGAADRLRLDGRFLGRRVRQQLRARQNEDLDRKAATCGPARSARPWSGRGSTACYSIRWLSTACSTMRPW